MRPHSLRPNSPLSAQPITDLSFGTGPSILLFIMGIGAAIRIIVWKDMPPGIAFDTTWDFADALRISRGIPFPAVFDTRSEPFYRWLLAAGFVLWGPTVFSALLIPILITLLTVALAYGAGLAVLVGRSWRRVGALFVAGVVAANPAQLFL